jgi:hypothetical protein
MLCELYSVLDGVRQIVFSAYRNVRGDQNESTDKLFRRAADERYGPGMPRDINESLANAYKSWFPRLREIRTENTHGEIGKCHLDPRTGKIDYIHPGLVSEGRALIIPDIIQYTDSVLQNVRELTEWLCAYLYSSLEPQESQILCGLYEGRAYERAVAPGAHLSLADGRCMSVNWFANCPDLLCPMADRCGAFRRPMPPDEFRRLKLK